jgi:potassium efflux system protein
MPCLKNITRNACLLAFLLLSCYRLTAQQHNSIHPKPAAVAERTITVKDTLVPFLVNKVQTYSFDIKRNDDLVRRGLNVGPIQAAIPGIQKRLDGFTKRLNDKARRMNIRSLNSGTILLKETTDQLTDYQTTLSTFYTALSRSNSELKKISNDPLLNANAVDTQLSQQMHDVLTDARRLDSIQKNTIAKVTIVRNKVSILLLQANDIVSELSYRTTSAKRNMWNQEDEPLLQDKPSSDEQPLSALIGSALKRCGHNIQIFLRNKWDIITIVFLIFALITAWCLSNIRRVRSQEDAPNILALAPFLKRSVVVGCIMTLVTIMPFCFSNPQMSFLHSCELLRLLAMSFLIFPYLAKGSKPLWLMLGLIWIYYAIDDLLLESAFSERWVLIVTAVLLALICIRIIRGKYPNFIGISESPGTKALAVFSLLQVLLSIIFNFTGRVTLAKIFGVSAVQCLVLGISLKVLCCMVIEAIYIQSEAYQESRFSDFINFKDLQHRFRRVLWVFASIIWFISFLRNVTLYDVAMHLIDAFFSTTRVIGNISFNYKSVAIFIGIIWFSSVISGFINFFFGHEKAGTTGSRKKIGSMMLLIRLAIWSIGFMVAIAAAGIPLDKISIMIGALGVGIGFGLQNIANNLVSGIILAFERPIQIGDQIEIGNKAGTVKEIGVRSSKIKSSDGSDIIIPNGDLLSQHLTNWTMKDLNKRAAFTISVSYNADILLVKKTIQDILAKNEVILQTPQPSILLQTFADSGFEVNISFWVPDLSKAGSIRSEVMIAVYNALKESGIELSYPIKEGEKGIQELKQGKT